jgi:hypothetical protein
MGFLTTLSSDELGAMLEPIQKQWTQFNNWMDSFFKIYLDPATGNTAYALKAGPADKLKNVIAEMEGIFADIAKFFTSDSMKALESMSWHAVRKAVKNTMDYSQIFTDLMMGHWGDAWKHAQEHDAWMKEQQAKIRGNSPPPVDSDAIRAAQDRVNSLVNAGASDEEIAKARQDLIDAEKAQTNSQQALKWSIDTLTSTLSGGGRAGGYGGGMTGGDRGLSDVDNAVYYEHPDTEGSSSQKGPRVTN